MFSRVYLLCTTFTFLKLLGWTVLHRTIVLLAHATTLQCSKVPFTYLYTPALVSHMYAISSYTSVPLTDSKPVTLHLASQVTCYDIFHLEHWKSGVFRWLQLCDIPNLPDLQKQLPHTQACFYLLLWNSFFAMGAYIHTCAFFSYLVPVIIFTDWPIHTYCYQTNLACWWYSGHNSVLFLF